MEVAPPIRGIDGLFQELFDLIEITLVQMIPNWGLHKQKPHFRSKARNHKRPSYVEGWRKPFTSYPP